VSIGATSAIFSVVDGVLLRPLPYPEADEIVTVAARTLPQVGGDDAPFSDRGYWHFVENNRAFEAFGGYAAGSIQWPLTGTDGPPVQLDVAAMTASAFEVVGMYPQRGRFPTPEEDVPDGPLVALLSDGLWRNRFGADPDIIGKTIELNGMTWEVIGVMPEGYDFPTRETDVWIPHQLDRASENFGGHHIFGIARLAPGMTIEAATGDAESLIARFDEVGYGPQWFQGVFSGEANVQTWKEGLVGDARQPLLILLGTVGFVLLIACSNLANLLLVRAESRTRERAVRMALGSGRARLIQYVLTESMLLSVVGGILGIALAFAATRMLVAFGPVSIPRLHEVGINGTVLLFTTGVAVFAGLLFGLIPALKAGSRKALGALKDGSRGSTIGRDRHRIRSLLVVGQVALALMLLVGSGLLVRSYQRLKAVDPGFQSGAMTFRLSPPPSKYPDAEATARFYDELVQRLEAIPGATSVGGINNLPLTGGGAILTVQIDEFPIAEDEFPPAFLARRVTPGYFEAMGIPIIEGREFTTDDHTARAGSIIISESVKQEFWPETSALGKRMATNGAPARVVGVVGDIHDESLEVPAEQFSYKPMLDSIGGGVRPMMMVVRTDGDPDLLIPGIREAVEELDPDLPITEIRSLDGILSDSLSRTSFTMTLLMLASAIALFLGAVGVYGVLSYVAAQRTPEMGVRLALGADGATVGRIILSQGMILAGVGVALGLGGAAALSGVLGSLLFGVSPLDPLTLVAVSLIFLGVAALASAVPAARAARIPPAIALRGE
jgi:predicted permease